MPWLLAADRGLLGRPLALLLQPSPEAETICQRQGWNTLMLRDDWPLAWLMEHLNGPLLPKIALVGELPVGATIPKGWLQVVEAGQLPQQPIHGPARLPALPGWDGQFGALAGAQHRWPADGETCKPAGSAKAAGGFE